MKTLVIYYSFEGNTKLIAESIAKTVGADILELKSKNETSPKGFSKYFWGGKQVLQKTKPDLLPFDKNPVDYDVLFIGTPVWAWSYTPVLNTFFSNHKLSNKKVALFCCHGGGKGNIFKKMKEALKDNEFLGEIDFRDPLKRNKDANLLKAEAWAKNIMNSLT